MRNPPTSPSAAVGWAGLVYVYRTPLFGPALLTACLAFVDAAEWQYVRSQLSRFAALVGSKPAGETAVASVGGR